MEYLGDISPISPLQGIPNGEVGDAEKLELPHYKAILGCPTTSYSRFPIL